MGQEGKAWTRVVLWPGTIVNSLQSEFGRPCQSGWSGSDKRLLWVLRKVIFQPANVGLVGSWEDHSLPSSFLSEANSLVK